MSNSPAFRADPWSALRAHTPARIGLGRVGTSLPTQELLAFGAAHAQARDAVLVPLYESRLADELAAQGWPSLRIHSRAPDRASYLRRPDWGRRLDEPSAQRLRALAAEQQADAGHKPSSEPGDPAAACDLALVLGDGLSSVAVQRHAVAVLAALRQALAAQPGEPLRLSPVLIATQARVALADEAGELLGARAALILLGERPGLSSPDSLGAYLTHGPRVGRVDAERNCVSNIRPQGLPPEQAGPRLAWLLREALRRRLSGVALKDDSQTPLLDAAG